MTFDPDWVVAPGGTLAESLVQWGLSVRMGARLLDMHEFQLEAILAGKDPITHSIALRLQALFGTSAEFWMNLERNYRDGLAQGKHDATNDDRELPTPTERDRLHRGGGGSRFDNNDDPAGSGDGPGASR